MSKIKHNSTIKQRRKNRVRAHLYGTAARPRLNVLRSNKHCYLQVIDDDAGKTIASSNDVNKTKKMTGTKTERAKKVAEDIAKQLVQKKVKELVYDRGHYRYHGRVEAIAQSLREAGLKL